MQNFISNCISKILNSTTDISSTVFVLPSKRGSIFIRKEIAAQLNKTILLPKIISIEDFIEDVSGLKTSNNLETLFTFYNIYNKIIPKELKETFDSFSKWSQLLIHDYNEIDRYLLNAEDFFNNLSNIKQIEKWDLKNEPTEIIQNYLDFWKNSYQYYLALKTELKTKKIAYQGLVYREAAENIESYAKYNKQHHYFLGFNALNAAEEIIFQKLLEQNLATVMWDTDSVFFNSKTHTAGLFLRKYKNEWNYYQDKIFSIISNEFKNDKQIDIFALPKNISQAKKVGELLQSLSNDELRETAVILGDENLLLPVLNSLPKNVTDVNITMGLSLKNVPLASFFENIFQLYVKQSGNHFYYKRILHLLHNNYTKILIGSETINEIIKEIQQNNRISLSIKDIKDIAPENKSLQLIFSLKHLSTDKCLDIMETLILKLKGKLKEEEKDENDELKQNVNRYDLEYLYRFNVVFNSIKRLQEKHQVLTNITTLHEIYKETINNETLDFSGEPVKGLQIMGMLETRILDFKRIILTSINEGILPSGKSYNSFIPFDLKIAFKLPTYFDKDAIYAYHFFRLMQRAKHVSILHNTEPDGLNAGEKSRFILQLEAIAEENHKITHSTNSPAIETTHKKLKEISTDETVLLRLKEIANSKEHQNGSSVITYKGGFSPSALTQYIRNPIDFYTQKILRIYEDDEVEETVAANTLGTIVHNTLEEFYKPLENEVLSIELIKKMQQNIEGEIKNQFKKEFKKGDVTKGKNLLIYNVAIRYVSNFLKEEIELVQNSKEVIIRYIEADLRTQLDINKIPFPIYITGKVDRIDEVDGTIRIIDYKTGKVETSQIQIHDWSLITSDYKKYSKPFQILAYAYMAKENNLLGNKPVEAGIISFKNLKKGFMKFGKKEKEGQVTKNNVLENQITNDVLSNYIDEVKQLISEICDIKKPFIEKEV